MHLPPDIFCYFQVWNLRIRFGVFDCNNAAMHFIKYYFSPIIIIITHCQWHRFLWLFLAISPYRPSRLHPVSIHVSFCISAYTGEFISSNPWENVAYGVVLHQQYSACLACLSWMVCVIGGKCLYNCCFVGCCFHDLFKTTNRFLE